MCKVERQLYWSWRISFDNVTWCVWGGVEEGELWIPQNSRRGCESMLQALCTVPCTSRRTKTLNMRVMLKSYSSTTCSSGNMGFLRPPSRYQPRQGPFPYLAGRQSISHFCRSHLAGRPLWFIPPVSTLGWSLLLPLFFWPSSPSNAPHGHTSLLRLPPEIWLRKYRRRCFPMPKNHVRIALSRDYALSPALEVSPLLSRWQAPSDPSWQ